MGRSFFSMGFSASPWAQGLGNPGTLVGPLHIENMTDEEIVRNAPQLLKMQPVPPGWVGTYPKIVKVGTKGEFIVYADGMAQYISYGRGNVGPPFQI